MKKILATLVCLLALSATSIPAAAQTRSRNWNRNIQTSRYDNYGYRDGRYRDRTYRNNVYNDYSNDRYGNSNDSYDNYRYGNRSVWEKHRDKITTAGGAAAGAILGGLVGGKKGAIIGALAGGGGAAVYTYKIRNR